MICFFCTLARTWITWGQVRVPDWWVIDDFLCGQWPVRVPRGTVLRGWGWNSLALLDPMILSRWSVWVISTNIKNKGKRDFLFPLFVIYSAYEQCYFHKGLLSHPLVNPIMKTGTSGMEQNKSFMSSLTVLSGFMALQRYSRQEMTPKARFLWCSVMSCTIHL